MTTGASREPFDILAAIDLHEGRVVRLRQGDFQKATAYGDDPTAVAVSLVSQGARWLHVVDLDGARAGRQVHGAVVAGVIAAVSDRCAVEVGGGIRDEATAHELLALGASRIVLGTAALREPSLVARVIESAGAARVAVAIDVRGGRVVGEAWRAGGSGLPRQSPDEAIARLADHGAATFEVTAIDQDGTLSGPDLRLLAEVVAAGRGAIIASGGIRSIDDLVAVRQVGCVGAIVGRALYEGTLDLGAAIDALR